MKTRLIQTCGLIAMTIACLSAPVALVALGGTFRMAARMADDEHGVPADAIEIGSTAIVLAQVDDRAMHH